MLGITCVIPFWEIPAKELKSFHRFAMMCFFNFIRLQTSFESYKIEKSPGKMPKDLSSFAEGEGFEPPVPCGTTVFKTAAIDHSAIPPGAKIELFLIWITLVLKNVTSK